jgi:SAM-dependent methyltransferase
MSPSACPCLLLFATALHSTGACDSNGCSDPSDPAALLQSSAQVSNHQDGQRKAVLEKLSELSLAEQKQVWWDLTQELETKGGLQYSGETPLRHTIDLWNKKMGVMLETEQLLQQRCAETGDGHFLRAGFSKVCATSLIADKFDDKADVKLDLNLEPAKAPEEVKKQFGTIDLIVSHQVFEHLSRPSLAMSNLNAMLKSGGRVFFSTPFVVPDHRSPKTDFFRYTVMAVDQLLQCAGFEVKQLQGLGNKLESLAYLAGVSSDMMDPKLMESGCDGKTTNDCANKVYSGVAAVAVKKEDKTFEQVHNCFG